MRPLTLSLALGSGALLAGFLAAVFLRERAISAGERGETPASEAVPVEPLSTTLRAIRAQESAWLGKRVRFVLQFRERVPAWDPFLSRFGPAQWTAFAAWPDEVFTWDPESYADSIRTLFVRRGSAPDAFVGSASPGERMEAVGTVREAFLDEPWIEIEGLVPLAESVGEGTILHVGRAREFMVQGQWELALQQFERAKAAPLPAHALADIERQIGECHRLREEVGGQKSGK